MKDAWILRLKDEAKDDDTQGEYYFNSDGEELDWLTEDPSDAVIYFDKEKAIELLKNYEQAIFEKYGADAICNFGYTNMMENFEFVEVEVTYPNKK